MSVTVDYNGVQMIRTGVPTTYIISPHSFSTGSMFYKIGRTKNLPSRVGTLLAAFNDGEPKGLQGFPVDLVGICPFEQAFGGCKFGDNCEDKQYAMTVLAHINGDIEAALHRRFAHLRLGTDDIHSDARSSEWFLPSYPDDEDYADSVDAWLAAAA
ncbi:MAG: hypothetical protein JWM76_4207 [Pseudonocardiales bacterium]|nr:hypothetical protein [Pseudonocardiales bacterium]